MEMPTTTTEATINTFVSCAAERDSACTARHPFGFAELYRAYRACRRGKRSTRKAQRYELTLLDRLVDTAQLLQLRRWHPSRSIRFVVTHPKPREILAAEFGDRVVHHSLVPWFERLYEPVFIFDSFANRKGKGSHAAVSRLQAFTRRHPRGYYLQLDIASFFNSINRRTLFGLLLQRVARDLQRSKSDPRRAEPAQANDMLWLARVLLTGNPALRAHYHGCVKDLARVPAHKQLANAPAETGLPIGNLTSQFFANVYLNELDQFIKHRLKVAAYIRYVDDFVLMHDDPPQLEAWREDITTFLRQHLGLELRDGGRLAPIGNGIDFLGYIVRPHYRLVRRRVVGHMHERLQAHAVTIVWRDSQVYDYAPGKAGQVQATLASYYAHFRHAQTAGLRKAVFLQHPWLAHILAETPKGGLCRCDAPHSVTSLASQWRYFRQRYPQHLLLLRVGNTLQARGQDAYTIARATSCPGLPLAQQRPGLGAGRSWPLAMGAQLRRRLRAQCLPYAYIDEAGWLKGGMKRRELRQLCVLNTSSSLPCLNDLNPTRRSNDSAGRNSGVKYA